MNLIVVYKDIGKIAAYQLKKLVSQKDDSEEEIVGTPDGSISVIAMDEKTYLENESRDPFVDPVLFIDDIKGIESLIPIAEPKSYGFGVEFRFGGPVAVIHVNPKALNKSDEYNRFYEQLNALTFQQIRKAPRGIKAFMDSILHGIKGYKRRNEDIKKQQLIYGVTKLYYDDLRDYMNSFGQNPRNTWGF